MKIYNGTRDLKTQSNQPVFVTDTKTKKKEKLAERQDLYSHSSSGFEWGYGGSGPAQLALSILADCIGDEFAIRWHQDFKFTFISRWKDVWSITSEEIKKWALTKRALHNSGS